MQFFFLIFLAFGLFVGGMLHSGFTGAFPWDWKAILFMLGIHVPAAGFGALIAAYAKQQQGKIEGIMSPGTWIAGLTISYLVGAIGVLVALIVNG